MNRLLQLSQRISAGKLHITEKFKHSMVICPVAIVHIIYFFFFLYMEDFLMAGYNLASTAAYLVCTVFLHKKKYSRIYYVASGEIVLNTILTTLVTGWDCGFSTFLFALAVAGYFISYTFPRHRLSIPFIWSIAAAIVYFSCYFYSKEHIPFHAIADPGMVNILYAFNCTCTFAFISVFSALFMLEMRMSQKKLFDENQMLEMIAGNDALTGLFNRWGMETELEKAVHGKNPFCLIMCDIDDFKQINDTYGHNCGDAVLKHIARLLSDSLPKDSCVCRWGGEEFLILLNGYSPESARELADHIRRSILASDTPYQNSTISHSITMGIASHHRNQSLDSLISKADMRLYTGKRQGKNVVIV